MGYTDVVTAQAIALTARRALMQEVVSRQVAAITLIQALGDMAAAVEIEPPRESWRPVGVSQADVADSAS